MDPSLPEDLVGHEISDTGHEGLVHERGFYAAPPSGKNLEELPATDRKCVRPQSADKSLLFLLAPSQPRTSQLSHVPIPELPKVELDHESIVTMPARGVGSPPEAPGHPEVQEERGSIGRCYQPLPMSLWFLEAVSAKGCVELVRGCVPNDGRIQRHHAFHPPAGPVTRPEAAFVFDIGKLWHAHTLRCHPSRAVSQRRREA
jgi:hypothetical protein